jgi:ABC-type molybdenum transport system ATPase subunit/photorepair protein PhrA
MVALLCLRLVTLQALAAAPFLLVDEPLEHLDPPNRRLLALLLQSASSSGGAPAQIIVTTYEESAVRALQQPQAGTTVQYLRAG